MMKWVPINLTDVQIGDYVKCETYTHSQKWMVRSGYDNYNSTKEGRVVGISYTPVWDAESQTSKFPALNLSDIMVDTIKGTDFLGPDPGSSGGYDIYKLVRTHAVRSNVE